MTQRFDRLGRLFSDVLPSDFRVILIRANRKLEDCRRGYIVLPEMGHDRETEAFVFRNMFLGVIEVLGEVAREADRKIESMKTPSTRQK